MFEPEIWAKNGFKPENWAKSTDKPVLTQKIEPKSPRKAASREIWAKIANLKKNTAEEHADQLRKLNTVWNRVCLLGAMPKSRD